MQSERKVSPPASGLNLRDILLIFFRHKWMILILSTLGFGAAAAIYKAQPKLYASKATIFIRYVVERSLADDYERQKTADAQDFGQVIAGEIELLTSRDVALTVADQVGVEKLAPGAGGFDPLETAAGAVLKGCEVTPRPAANILEVSFKNENPGIVRDVLTELIAAYRNKHFAVHRSSDSESMSKRVDVVKMRMDDTEKALQELRDKAGVVSLEVRRAALDKVEVEMQQELLEAEGELSVQKAVVAAAERKAQALAGSSKPLKAPSPQVIRDYRLNMQRLAGLLEREADLSQTYVDGDPRLIKLRKDIEERNAAILKMEEENPGLASVASEGPGGEGIDPLELERQRAILEVIQQKVDRFNKRLEEIAEEASKLTEYGPQISELERRLEVDQQNYIYFQKALEKAKVDAELDPSRAPSIEVIDKPSPPRPSIDKRMLKIILAVAGSGLALGLGLAFVIEMFFRRGIRKPQDLETELHIPLLLAIPRVPRLKGGAPLLELREEEGAVPVLTMSGDLPASAGLRQPDHFIQPYTEAIRDRLVFHFELNNMRHKPKLVAFTGLSDGAGTSTLAAGLAHAFANEDDAKVLLVDMNSEADDDGVYNGAPRCSLPGALGLDDDGEGQPVRPGANLVVARARSGRARDGEFAPRSLYELMPNMRASDYDYIIFDMPPVGLMSPTLAMAGLMDKVLLVLDSEKTDRDVLQRRYSELASGRAHVSCIYNKARRHAPKWIQGEV